MAVAFPIFIVLFFLEISIAYEKKIKENWGKLYYPRKVYQLYKLLDFRCIWYCEGEKTKEIEAFERILTQIIHHGLDPKDYEPIKELYPELAITDSLLKLAYHLYYGRTKPSELYKGWNIPLKQDRVVQTLANLIREGRLEDMLSELSPKNPQYWFLVEQAKTLKELSGFEWKPIKLSKPLRYGDKSPCLEEIKFRLFLLGDLKEYTSSDIFDKALFDAVKSFQERHGLPESGVIDSKTLEELNISPTERLKQVYINLEKHRWLPEDFKKAVVVNVPSFELFLVNKDSIELHSKVIVGRNYKEDFRPTPLLYSRINSITINPPWYVPRSIAVKDILPKVRKDPSYLRRKDFKVFQNGIEVNPEEMDWNSLSEKNFPYSLVQSSGPKNALGRIKFNFPNPFDVYLHDTPDVWLFKKTKRAFSSGCIRVEMARELALRLLGEGWSRKRLEDLILQKETISIKLKEPVTIYILYFTAFERKGAIHFREDIYGYDTILSRAFSKSGGKR